METVALIISIVALIVGIVAIVVAARKKNIKEVVTTTKTEVVYSPVEHPFVYDKENEVYSLNGDLNVSGEISCMNIKKEG